MKLRSSLTRRETNVPSLRAPGNSTTTNDGPISKAMRNPLVLGKIFSKLDIMELMSARLVCRQWADIGAGSLGNRAYFDVEKLYRYDGNNLYKATAVHEKLLRSLIIWDTFHASIPAERSADVVTKIFADVSRETRDIEFYVGMKRYATAFLNGLATLDSTQIQNITVIVQPRTSNADKGRCLMLRNLPIQTNLTSIKFKREGGYITHTFQPLLQILVDAAPNLTSLDVSISFCPNLEGCKRLKVLKFQYTHCEHKGCPDFNVAAVMGMLTPVKDSLIDLELSQVNMDVHNIHLEGRRIDVPVLPNLVSLSIIPPCAYLIHGFYDEKHLPKLKKLSLKNVDSFGRTFLPTHLTLWKRHRGVESLELKTLDYCRTDGEFGERIVKIFPSVKKIDLTMTPNDESINNVAITIMEPFQSWDLEQSNIVVRNMCVASGVVGVLRNMSTWTGVKSVDFESTRIKKADFSASIQDITLHSTGLKRVEFSGIVDPEIVEVIRPIFEASGAPVQFKGGVCHD